MRYYLVRHAHAVDLAEDPLRPLSRRGRRQVAVLARFLAKAADFAPDEIWQSPLVRAQETAALLRERLGLKARVVTVPGLETGAGVRVLAARLRKSRQSLALVGHEPHLGALASLLVGGSPEPPLFVLKKGAVLALERTGQRWAVLWQVHPDLLETRT